MAWSERQAAMLRTMGLRIWPTADRDAGPVEQPEEPEALAPQPAAGLSASIAPIGPVAPTAPTAPIVLSTPAAPTALAGPTPSGLTLDWPALREAVAACRACGLCESRTQTVFGVGHRSARWMIVGEAPGEQEDRIGEPFVGPAGQLLDAMLRALGLSRAEDGPAEQRVYIANTLKCRPPRNRNPAPEEMARCEPFLVRQIELVQPRIILAMGRFAVQALLRSGEPVGKLRGRIHAYQGVPLIVTYHPAYLLRTLSDKARAWEDLCLAATVAEREPRVPS